MPYPLKVSEPSVPKKTSLPEIGPSAARFAASGYPAAVMSATCVLDSTWFLAARLYARPESTRHRPDTDMSPKRLMFQL